jgi:hypothetical protein
MAIKRPEIFRVKTCMGKVYTSFDHPLYFLTEEEKKELDTIGYTGRNSINERISREDYLNSIGKGSITVMQIKWDNGDFTEEFIISRAE